MDPIIQRFRQWLERQRVKRLGSGRRQSVDQAQHYQANGRIAYPMNQPAWFKQKVRRVISWGSTTTDVSQNRQSSRSDTSSEFNMERPPSYELATDVLPSYYDENGRPGSPPPIYIDEQGRPRSPIPFYMLSDYPMGLQPSDVFHEGQHPFGHDDIGTGHVRRDNSWTNEEGGRPQVQEREISPDEDDSEWEDYTGTVAGSSPLQVDNTIAPLVEELEGNPSVRYF